MTLFTSLVEPDVTLLYDITSLSRSAKLLSLLEPENNHVDGLSQINFSLVIDEEKGIPIRYDIYTGGIADISTLKITVQRLIDAGAQKIRLVMDREFFSQTTLAELIDSQIPFIIPASFQFSSVKELLNKSQSKVKSGEYLHKLNDNSIFAMPVTLDHMLDPDDNPGVLYVKGYCYYDPEREQEERKSIYIQLSRAVEKLQNSSSKNWKQPETVAREVSRGFYKYIDWNFLDGKFSVLIKQKAITQRLNRMGKFILFYNGEMNGWSV